MVQSKNASTDTTSWTSTQPTEDGMETWLDRGAMLLTLAFFLFLFSHNFGFNERTLDRTVRPCDKPSRMRPS